MFIAVAEQEHNRKETIAKQDRLSHNLLKPEHFVKMIDYSLHKSDTASTNYSLKDQSRNLLRALYWYRLGKR